MDRRTFGATFAGAAAASLLPWVAHAATTHGQTVLYRAIGATLTLFSVDAGQATLSPGVSLQLPSVIQYAWFHPSGPFLYVTTSDAPGGNVGAVGHLHRLCALKIAADGTLSFHGDPTVLPARPVFNSVDATGRFALVCYPSPARLSIHHLNEDGSVGSLVEQSAALDLGIFPHQIRTLPDNRSVVLVTRGINPTANAPEQPGALELYRFEDGQLTPLEQIQVGGHGGIGYGPRHLDFHPHKPWAYVALERENRLHMHRIMGERLAPEPSYNVSTTVEDYAGELPQAVMAGAIQVHPRGHTVYVSNRDSATVEFNGQRVFKGGENDIVVFAIDPVTGAPKPVQRVDPQGFHVRAFSIDPSGRLLVAAALVDMDVREGNTVRHVPAALSVFRIAADGRLTFVRKYDAQLNGQQQAWVGMAIVSA